MLPESVHGEDQAVTPRRQLRSWAGLSRSDAPSRRDWASPGRRCRCRAWLAFPRCRMN